MQLQSGVQVSIDGVTWYKLTDHNRQPINMSYEVIEKTSRMADGTLRRYVIARKHKISLTWNLVPTLTSNAVDYKAGDANSGKAGAWMKSFYEANIFIPVYVKVIGSSISTQNSQSTTGFSPDENTYKSSFDAPGSGDLVYNAYITNFSYNIMKRNAGGNSKGYDLVDITMEFTEI